MAILMSVEIKGQMKKEVSACNESIQVITAFCKEDGLEFIDKQLNESVTSKRLLVRFRMEDIISGATDMDIYEFCKRNCWDLFIRFDLHAKTYIFDNKRCVIGSANLTNSGMLMDQGGNYEIASICTLGDDDLEKVGMLFDGGILVTDEVYALMLQEMEQFNDSKKVMREWSKDIKKLFDPHIKTLFTYDFPEVDSYKLYIGRGIEFLGVNQDWTLEGLKIAFEYSKIYIWLKQLLADNDGEMYFGAVSAALHNTLVNDPKPYRKEVKELLARLLLWISELELEEIVIDRPNYSQRIQLK